MSTDPATDHFRAWAGAMLARHHPHHPHHPPHPHPAGEGRAGQSSAEQPGTVYQTSTMAALLDGIYDGDVTIAELLTHGDFGLGTFNHLDGEMVILDGTCYHLRADGSATVAAPQDMTPFAAVLWFRPEPSRPPCTRRPATHAPNHPHTSCVAIFYVNLYDSVNFSTLERSKCFAIGKVYVITPQMTGL